jgi:hypothetical protein
VSIAREGALIALIAWLLWPRPKGAATVAFDITEPGFEGEIINVVPVPEFPEVPLTRYPTSGIEGQVSAEVISAAGGVLGAQMLLIDTAALAPALLALLSNPITIAVAAAIVGIVAFKKVGAGRRTADRFVRQVQNPFGAALADIVDGRVPGLWTETVEQANRTRAAILALAQEFNEARRLFAQEGRNEATVARQAGETIDPIISNIVGGIDRKIRDVLIPAGAWS